MNPPQLPMRVVGHPLGALVTLIVGGLGIASAHQSGISGAPLIIAGIVLLCMIGEASQQRLRYRAWKREWEGVEPKPVSWNGAAFAILTVLVMIGAYKTGHPGEAGRAILIRIGIGYAMAFGPLILWVAMRPLWRRRRMRPAKAVSVSVVATNIMAVPSLKQAYRALPTYCQQVMGK